MLSVEYIDLLTILRHFELSMLLLQYVMVALYWYLQAGYLTEQ